MTVTRFQNSLHSGPAITPVANAPARGIYPATGADILAALGQANFTWDIVGDTLHWSDNVAAVLCDIPQAALARASGFSKLIEPVCGIRNDAVLNSTMIDSGKGVPYQIEYGLRRHLGAGALD